MTEEAEEPPDLELPLDDTYSRFRERLRDRERGKETAAPAQWGGWMRRCCAFFLDLGILFFFFLLLFYLTHVAYSVGMAANQRYAAPDTASWGISAWGCLFLFSWYFILFHGLAGKTVGKWLLGLHVVGRDQAEITYRQAVLRLIGYFASGFFGLGFLWILISRERRGWHDYFAGTWVIRERSPGTSA